MSESIFDSVHEILATDGERFRAEQVRRAVFVHGRTRFADMHELPSTVRRVLAEHCGADVVRVQAVAHTRAHQTHKVLFELADGNRVEAVHMTYRGGRRSVCVSSQAGCGLACAFCATGAVRLKRNLSVDEILGQVLWFASRGLAVDGVAFMGMGEPLANPAVFGALERLTDRRLFAMSPRRLTVSTVGVVPAMRRLTSDHPGVALTVSVHSPFHEERSRLVPMNRRHPLDEVLGATDEHVEASGRKTYLAYALMDEVNDSPEHVAALIELVLARRFPHRYHVSLIRYHPAAGVPDVFRPPRRSVVDRFLRGLQAAGIGATLRPSFGVDVDAACGQLYARYTPVSSAPASAAPEAPPSASPRTAPPLPASTPPARRNRAEPPWPRGAGRGALTPTSAARTTS